MKNFVDIIDDTRNRSILKIIVYVVFDQTIVYESKYFGHVNLDI